MADSAHPTRRDLLATVAALAAAGCATARVEPAVPQSETAAGAAPAPRLPHETIAAAERLAGVEYTPEEREQIASTIEEQLAQLRELRQLRFPNELPPAVTFDPARFGIIRAPAEAKFQRAKLEVPDVPRDDEELAYAPVSHLSVWLQQQRLSSARLTSVCLARLERIGRRLECVANVTRRVAEEQAAQADSEIAAGKYRGPLHGVPYGAKDLLDTAGIETAWGAEPYRGRVPQKDAEVVRRLREAGAVLVAKTALGALAYGDRWYSGRSRNPWFLDEGSSGSSAGSASGVAAGLFAFALGTETLGSIVSPSMRCGTTGLRPTFGRVPRTGAMALCWSLDKIGPIARTVEDTAFVLQALNGRDDADVASVTRPLEYDGTRAVKGMRVGFVPAWFKDASDPERAALAALDRIGVERIELKPPELPYEGLMPILAAEAAAAFEELTLSGRDDQLGWQDPEAWPNFFRMARFIPAIDVVQAERLRTKVIRELTAWFDKVDAVLGPSFAGGMLTATNFTGQPSLTLRAGFIEINKPRPMGPTEEKLLAAMPMGGRRRVPVGITLWGRLFDEGPLFTLGRALEAELGVWSERPRLDS